MRLTENGCVEKKKKGFSIPPQGLKYDETHLIIKIIIGKHISSEPFVQWQCIFAQILLPEHVLVPYDKLKHAEYL
jgi:hypothetical protein